MRVDVAVLGGGPGGHAAALEAARRGASVVIVEGERLGGQCVHATCVPSGLMLGAAASFLDGQELAMAGVFDLGDELRLGRAGARRDALVAKLASGINVSLRTAGVPVVEALGRLDGPRRIVAGDEVIEADHVVVATGARWEPPRLDGVADEHVVTLDAVVRLDAAPSDAVVLGGGPARTAFAVEAAVLLASAGAEVTYVLVDGAVVGSLDADVDAAVRAGLEALGITCADHADLAGASLVVASDGRRPNTAAIGLETVGLEPGDALPVDDRCRVEGGDGLLATGDVTGATMVTAAAIAGGRVAGANAVGGDERVRLDAIPHALHTFPPTAWVGASAADAGAAGHDVAVAIVDLAWTANAITGGGHEGMLKLVADRELGQVLGVHATGPGAEEAVALGALAVQAELRVADLAASVQWHPHGAEALVDAARQLA